MYVEYIKCTLYFNVGKDPVNSIYCCYDFRVGFLVLKQIYSLSGMKQPYLHNLPRA